MTGRRPDLLLGAFVLGLGLSITLAEVALALLAVRCVVRLLGEERLSPPRWPLAVPFAAWGATSLLAGAFSSRPAAILAAVRGLLLIAAFYVVLHAVSGSDGADRFLTGLLAVLGVVSALSILQVAFCPRLPPLASFLGRFATKCQRAHGFFSIYMTLAGVLSLVLLAAAPGVLDPVAGGRRWRLLGWLTGAAALAFTLVRGAWVGFVVGLAVVGSLVRRGRLLLLGGMALVLVAALAFPGVRQRALSIVDPTDPTAHERRLMWRSGLAIAREHPLTGIGPGQVSQVYPAYAAPEARNKARGHLHNTPLQVLVERGLLGLAAWGSIFAAFFWHAARILAGLPTGARRERRLVIGSIAGVAGFLVGGLTEYNFGDSEVVLVAYSIMALPFSVARRVSAIARPATPAAAAGPRGPEKIVLTTDRGGP